MYQDKRHHPRVRRNVDPARAEHGERQHATPVAPLMQGTGQ